MKQQQKFLVVLIIFLLIIPTYGNLFQNDKSGNLNPTNDLQKIDENMDTLSSTQNQIVPGVNISKIFPLILKGVERAELCTIINFTVQNTMELPLHNFSLKYHRIKDAPEEYAISIDIFPASTDFLRDIEALGDRIIFTFKMKPLAEIPVNKTIILSLKFYANLSNSDLVGEDRTNKTY